MLAYVAVVNSFTHVSHNRLNSPKIRFSSAKNPFQQRRAKRNQAFMVISSPDDIDEPSSRAPESNSDVDNSNSPSSERIAPKINLPDKTSDRKRKRKKYQRKKPRRGSEEAHYKMRKSRQAEYENMRKGNKGNLWDFESLFPDPVWDNDAILKDLYEVSDRDSKRGGKDRRGNNGKKSAIEAASNSPGNIDSSLTKELTSRGVIGKSKIKGQDSLLNAGDNSTKIDRPLTRMVEDRLYGFKRDQMGDFEYDTSLMGEGAVKFRDGIRLGNSLKVNADRLSHFAKKELNKGRLEEAEELYEKAIEMSPRDGRAYLGISRVAQRRRDFKYAKDCLRLGIANSYSDGITREDGVKIADTGANPFLVQALGTLEERMGHLAEAERLYIAAARSRPSHAAAWVALAQLRTRKLRQGPNAGRMCYKTAEFELKRACLKQSSHVYTAWAGLEWKSGEIRNARILFNKALEIDPKCSAAWNQLGVMEGNEEHWEEAEKCFETVLKFDRRNSRVLQAYAIMETKRPDSDSRRAIGLFEKALKANPRDGGVLQAYALYVAKLGDIDSAREL